MRAIELAVYADSLAGESAALAARAERMRSRLRQGAIERQARRELPAPTVERLAALGLLAPADARGLREELRSLESALAAVEELQAWVEARLDEAGSGEPYEPDVLAAEVDRGVSATSRPPSSS